MWFPMFPSLCLRDISMSSLSGRLTDMTLGDLLPVPDEASVWGGCNFSCEVCTKSSRLHAFLLQLMSKYKMRFIFSAACRFRARNRRPQPAQVGFPVPERLRECWCSVQLELWTHSRIRIHEGVMQVWNSGGERPEFCDILERIAQGMECPVARVWKGPGLPTRDQGIRVLGNPFGARGFRRSPFARTSPAALDYS